MVYGLNTNFMSLTDDAFDQVEFDRFILKRCFMTNVWLLRYNIWQHMYNKLVEDQNVPVPKITLTLCRMIEDLVLRNFLYNNI